MVDGVIDVEDYKAVDTEDLDNESKDETKYNKIIEFSTIQKVKSFKRSCRRGNCNESGVLYPKRPFNNRKPTKGRNFNESKKRIYFELKDYRRRVNLRESENLTSLINDEVNKRVSNKVKEVMYEEMMHEKE